MCFGNIWFRKFTVNVNQYVTFVHRELNNANLSPYAFAISQHTESFIFS